MANGKLRRPWLDVGARPEKNGTSHGTWNLSGPVRHGTSHLRKKLEFEKESNITARHTIQGEIKNQLFSPQVDGLWQMEACSSNDGLPHDAQPRKRSRSGGGACRDRPRPAVAARTGVGLGAREAFAVGSGVGAVGKVEGEKVEMDDNV